MMLGTITLEMMTILNQGMKTMRKMSISMKMRAIPLETMKIATKISLIKTSW
jgi:hypothetical protein